MSDLPYISRKGAENARRAQVEQKSREAVARELASLRLIQDVFPHLPHGRRTAIEWTRRRLGVQTTKVIGGWVLGSHNSSGNEREVSGPTHVAVSEDAQLFGGQLTQRQGTSILTVAPWFRRPQTVDELITIHETEQIVFSALQGYATDVSWFLQNTAAVQEGIQRISS